MTGDAIDLVCQSAFLGYRAFSNARAIAPGTGRLDACQWFLVDDMGHEPLKGGLEKASRRR